AKVGGLADVVFGLSNELEIRGNSVEIILPKYDCLRYDHIWGLCETYRDLWVPWFGGAIHCTVFFGFVHGRKCFFIEPHSGDNYFNRGCVYGFNDDVMRFAFFTRAAMEFLLQSGKRPDIIHCHDWQTALAPVLLYEIYQHLGMGHSRVCFTIHNFKHQGVTGAQVLHATGLNRPDYYFHYDRLRDNHNATAINLMKGGVVYSNFVTTVSPRHAYEAKDQGQGFGLESTLHIHHGKYGGVVNGIDYGFWNPEIDPHIPVHYSVDSIDGKYENKRALRHRLMLADNQKPIIAFVGRLDPQKGLELIRHAIFYTLARGGQFVLLGSSPDGQINSHFWGLKHHLNDHPDVHIEVGYNEELSHLIYAGADMVLVPSRFEPCGLTQLIALRYGTVPVVREVGGLADTVVDKDFSSRPLHERTGYVFRDYDGAGLESALGRAISCYYEFPEHFRELMKNAMRADYSWKNPGQDYLNIYHLIRNR
ncbi:MAG: glycogen synthase, partial [Methylococcaceae bacterium]|nr:glycogen synthase [Methylococcaceae bacterium]